MPSEKPRLTLTVPNDLNSDIKQLSDRMGMPSSKLVIMLLEEIQPSLKIMISTYANLDRKENTAISRMKQSAVESLLKVANQHDDLTMSLFEEK